MGFSIITQSPRPDNQIKNISLLNAFLVLLVAVGSFALSYNNLRQMAAEYGIPGPLSYIWPLLIDFALVVFSLSVVVAYARAESTWRQWSLVIVYTIATVAFNIWHSEPDLTARIVSAIAPISLFFSFELLMNQVKNQMTRKGLTLSLAQLEEMLNTKRLDLDNLIEEKQTELDTLINSKQSELDGLNSEADELNQSIEQSKATLKQLKEEIRHAESVQHSSIEHAREAKSKQDTLSIEQRRAALIDILSVEGDINTSTLADRLNVSRGTVYNDLAALSETGVINKNGNGWVVVS